MNSDANGEVGDFLERIADGRTDLVFDLLAAGRPANATDATGVALIRWCAYYGDTSAVRRLLDAGEQLASLGPNYDLNGAAFHGHWQLCQFLLERGADSNYALANGERALHAATSRRERPAANRVLRVLLDHGADVNVATIPGEETGSFLRDARTRGESPLHRAAAFGDEETLDLLLAAGASREAQDAYGETPLAWASWHGRPAYLVEKLCFGEHRIHPDAVALSRRDARDGWTSNMAVHLLGKPHLP